MRSIEINGRISPSTNITEKLVDRYDWPRMDHDLEGFVKNHFKSLKKEGGPIDTFIMSLLHPVAAEGMTSGIFREKEDEFDKNVYFITNTLTALGRTNEEKAFIARNACGKIALLLYREAHKEKQRPAIAISHEFTARRTLLRAVEKTEELLPDVRIDRGWIHREIITHSGTSEEIAERIIFFVCTPPVFPTEG